MKKSIRPDIMVAKHGDSHGSGKAHVFYMKRTITSADDLHGIRAFG